MLPSAHHTASGEDTRLHHETGPSPNVHDQRQQGKTSHGFEILPPDEGTSAYRRLVHVMHSQERCTSSAPLCPKRHGSSSLQAVEWALRRER